MATCNYCGVFFTNRYQLGPHTRTCRHRVVVPHSPESPNFPESSVPPDLAESADPPVVREPVFPPINNTPVNILQLARRPRGSNWGICEEYPHAASGLQHVPGPYTKDYKEVRLQHIMFRLRHIMYHLRNNKNDWCDTSCFACDTFWIACETTRNVCDTTLQVQLFWTRYIRRVSDLCAPDFWQLYRSVRHQNALHGDAVLSQVLKIIRRKHKDFPEERAWPTSSKSLRAMVQRKLGVFWDYLIHTHTIDLSKFELPGVSSINFRFVDPLYVWIQQSNKCVQKGHKLVWKPRVMRHPVTHEPVYGAGLSYGLLLRAAVQGIPAGGRVALINLSWDAGDTVYASKSAVPICVQVMNLNSAPVESVGLVGYLPSLEVSDSLKKEQNYVKAQTFLLQACIGKIVQVCFNLYNMFRL